jgi:hypothetical protein
VISGRKVRDKVRDMAFAADHMILLDRLDEALRDAPEPTLGLLAKLIVGACVRIPVLGKSATATRIGWLAEKDAWTEAALALIELEVPDWKLRRLVYEDGEWFCSLSRQPNLPIELDDTADGSHAVMSLAILLAFLRARRSAGLTAQPRTAVPAIAPAPVALMCCDNFA